MFGKFSYLFYTFIFTLPLTAFLWLYFSQILKKNFWVILLTTGLLTFYGFFLWPTGLAWGTWAYNKEKLLGFSIFGTVFEDIAWWFLIVFLLSSFVVIIAYKEEKHEEVFRR